ncbi:hypothetical protein [Mesorhizobium sp. M0715]|uniref:hypothetical protein n=1 Tax=Mesorhizobium sp. M0715 TaxID=2956990 RepID=UPI003338D1C5
MAHPEKETDEKKFNETLQRMLKTPPKMHDARPPDKTSVDKAQDSSKGAAKSKG